MLRPQIRHGPKSEHMLPPTTCTLTIVGHAKTCRTAPMTLLCLPSGRVTSRCMLVIGCCYFAALSNGTSSKCRPHPPTRRIQYAWALLYAYSYCFAMSVYNANKVTLPRMPVVFSVRSIAPRSDAPIFATPVNSPLDKMLHGQTPPPVKRSFP